MTCSHLVECIQSIESTQKKYVECELQQCLKSCDIRKVIALEEHKKRYVLQNNGDVVAVYRVDGQIVTSNRTNVPNLRTDPQYLRIQKAFMKHGGNLRTSPNSISECVDELC